MKNFFALSAVMVALCACTENPEVNEPGIGGGAEDVLHPITANISFAQKEADDAAEVTRIVSDYGDTKWKFSWERNDPVYVVTPCDYTYPGCVNSLQLEQTSYDKDESTYAGDYATMGATTWLCFIYSKESGLENLRTPFAFDLTEQDGALSDLYMMSDKIKLGDYSFEDGLAPKLKNVGACLQLNIDFGDSAKIAEKTLNSVIVEGLNSYAKAVIQYEDNWEYITTFNWNNPYYDGDNTFGYIDINKESAVEITVTPDEPISTSASTKLYVNVLPTKLKTNEAGVKVTLCFSDGTSYTFNKSTTAGKNIERAGCYEVDIVVDGGSDENWGVLN